MKSSNLISTLNTFVSIVRATVMGNPELQKWEISGWWEGGHCQRQQFHPKRIYTMAEGSIIWEGKGGRELTLENTWRYLWWNICHVHVKHQPLPSLAENLKNDLSCPKIYLKPEYVMPKQQWVSSLWLNTASIWPVPGAMLGKCNGLRVPSQILSSLTLHMLSWKLFPEVVRDLSVRALARKPSNRRKVLVSLLLNYFIWVDGVRIFAGCSNWLQKEKQRQSPFLGSSSAWSCTLSPSFPADMRGLNDKATDKSLERDRFRTYAKGVQDPGCPHHLPLLLQPSNS